MRHPPRLFAAAAGTLLPAIVVFALAYDTGGYSVDARGSWAIGTWWLLALGTLFGWWSLHGLPPAAKAVAGLASLFALLTLASAFWSANDADALTEFNRVSFYVGVFLLTLLARRWLPASRICDGVALGLSALAAIAVLSRVAPGLFPDDALAAAFPGTAARLSYPVGYWNGLAIAVALAVPLLLRRAASDASAPARAVAVAPLPAIAATIYLASSRGGVATAAVGVLAYLVLTGRRWQLLGALAAAAVGTALALATIVADADFADRPELASTADRTWIALMLVAGTVVAFLLQLALATTTAGRPAPSRTLGRALAAAATVVVLVGVVAADPLERFRAFREPPPLTGPDQSVQGHLVSVGGSGRWQFWETAADAWRDRPLHGHGAGSFEAWWAQHGSLPVFVRDAHSLYLETLAELGLAGLVLLLAAGAVGLWAALRETRVPDRREPAAAATAVVAAYAVAAGLDWVWELPAVTLVAVVCLASALGRPEPATRTAGAAKAVFAGVAVALVAAQAIPYLGDQRIRESQTAAARGQLGEALDAARAARDLQSWAPEPWLQLALVNEQRGQLEPALTAIERAVDADSRDWRLQLVAARLQTKLGRIPDARRSLRRAIELNPRSPLFTNLP